MWDVNGRNIDYIRISITDRCNLRCKYCMPEEGVSFVPHEQILSFDEIIRICRCMAKMGIHKIKLTGGEPLVRRGCPNLIAELKRIPGIEKITMTTNGILLGTMMKDLSSAGLDALNISLDTLDPKQYAEITRGGDLRLVMRGLEEAMKYPHIPIKINCVPASDDLKTYIDLAGLAWKYPIHVRFIEMMPLGLGKQFSPLDEDVLKAVLEQAYGPMTTCTQRYGNGPSHYYSINGFQGKIGFISAMTHKFCNQCNRVRLTAEGYLKACLQYQDGAGLRDMMRGGWNDEELEQVISDVIYHKPLSHEFYKECSGGQEYRGMSQIGG